MDELNKKERFVIIDNLYTYGMLLVLLGHVGLSPGFDNTYIYKWIYAFHMPLFFWIAGYLFDIRVKNWEFIKKRRKNY